MSEYEYLNLFYIFLISNAMYFVGFAIFTWLGFRFANAIYQGDAGDNVVGKIFATAYCVLVAASFTNSGLIAGYVFESYTASICAIEGASCGRLEASLALSFSCNSFAFGSRNLTRDLQKLSLASESPR